MKVKDIMKHSNATITYIVDNKDKERYQTWGIINYMQYENKVWKSNLNCYSYDTMVSTPKEILNLTVDFIAPQESGRLTIYTK